MAPRILFFGSPQFAVPSLEALSNDENCTVAAVVTQPDRRAGRGRDLVAPAVKRAAQTLGLPVWQPETLRSDEARAWLNSIGVDLFVVVAYGELFQRATLSIPRHGCLNVHPSLLPRYRGSAPIQQAILNGDDETGVSIIQMVRRLDAGPIVAQQRFMLDDSQTGGSVSDALAKIAGALLPAVVLEWTAGRLEPKMQDDAIATYSRELTKADGEINWGRRPEEIERQIRAFSPWPMAWTMFDGSRIVVESAVPENLDSLLRAGSLSMDGRGVLVSCSGGTLRLVNVRPEGKRSMAAADWFRGLHAGEHPRFERTTASGE